MGDDISTDEIMRAGAEVLPFRSNIPAISSFVYDRVDPNYPSRAQEAGDHAIVGGNNYGQGSSREHSALAPRYLGLRVVVAERFARIHWQNLINFGVLPLTYAESADCARRTSAAAHSPCGICTTPCQRATPSKPSWTASPLRSNMAFPLGRWSCSRSVD